MRENAYTHTHTRPLVHLHETNARLYCVLAVYKYGIRVGVNRFAHIHTLTGHPLVLYHN
jgi:hypothetical protein